MSSNVTSQITRLVVTFSVVFAGAAFLFGGLEPAVGAAIGGLVATINWLSLRWITVRVTNGSLQRQAGLMFLLVLKFGVMIAVCYALITRWGVHPVGFAVGLGALVAAIFVGTAMSVPTLTIATSEES